MIKNFLSNYWFPMMMTALAVCVFSVITMSMNERASKSKACIAAGAVLVKYDGISYCAAPSNLMPVEIK